LLDKKKIEKNQHTYIPLTTYEKPQCTVSELHRVIATIIKLASHHIMHLFFHKCQILMVHSLLFGIGYPKIEKKNTVYTFCTRFRWWLESNKLWMPLYLLLTCIMYINLKKLEINPKKCEIMKNKIPWKALRHFVYWRCTQKEQNKESWRKHKRSKQWRQNQNLIFGLEDFFDHLLC